MAVEVEPPVPQPEFRVRRRHLVRLVLLWAAPVTRPARRSILRLTAATASCRPAGLLLALAFGVLCSLLLYLSLNAWVAMPWARSALSSRHAAKEAGTDESVSSPDVLLLYRSAPPQLHVAPTQVNPRGVVEAEAGDTPVVVGSARRYELRMRIREGTKADRPIALLEVRRERSATATSVVVDVAYWGGARWVRLEWWKLGNLAPSNHIIDLTGGPLLPQPTFPTSTAAVVSWIRSSLYDTIKQLSPEPRPQQKHIRDFGAPLFETALQRDWGHLGDAHGITFLRIINGGIQFATFVAFFAAIAVLCARFACYVHAERDYSRALGDCLAHWEAQSPSTRKTWWDTLLTEVDRFTEHYRARWAESSGIAQLWRTGLTAVDKHGSGATVGFVDSRQAWLTDRRDSRRFFLRFLIGAIPAIGFIGTVVGIGLALMGTGAVLSDQLAKQQSGVSVVALNLGLAFDTTLVALLLSLLALALSGWLQAAEEAIVHDAHDYFMRAVESHGDGRAHTTGDVSPRVPEARPVPAAVGTLDVVPEAPRATARATKPPVSIGPLDDDDRETAERLRAAAVVILKALLLSATICMIASAIAG